MNGEFSGIVIRVIYMNQIKCCCMKSVITPKSIPDGSTWYGNIKAGGPTPPRIVVEVTEYSEESIFIHPAEKPKANSPADREHLFEPKY